MIDLKKLFTPADIVQRMKEAPKIVTPVLDTVFTNRPTHESPIIGREVVQDLINTAPLVRRGAQSVAVGDGGLSVAYYEPLPLRPSIMITGQDLNNLRTYTKQGLQQWAAQKQQKLFNVVRRSTEAMCAIALSGTLAYSVKLEGGRFDNYIVDFGIPLSVTPNVPWDNSSIKLFAIFSDLQNMEEALQEKGYGSSIEFWAGKDAYLALMAAAENFKSTAKLRVEIAGQGINIGGYLVKRRAERYQAPDDPTKFTNVVPANTVMAIATDAGHAMPYAAIDDLKSGLRAMAFFVKAIELDDPSGYKLIAESKPFPAVNTNGICTCVVTGSGGGGGH